MSYWIELQWHLSIKVNFHLGYISFDTKKMYCKFYVKIFDMIIHDAKMKIHFNYMKIVPIKTSPSFRDFFTLTHWFFTVSLWESTLLWHVYTLIVCLGTMILLIVKNDICISMFFTNHTIVLTIWIYFAWAYFACSFTFIFIIMIDSWSN